jgi:hypothetical protein
MQSDSENIEAWLLCQDMLNKAKNELVTQAIETLHDEINAKNIEINGSLISLPDKPKETEMDMFIINKLLGEEEKMKEMYGNYIKSKETDSIALSASMVERMEKLKKFLLSIEKISILMHYSNMIDAWMNDIGMHAAAKDPAAIIAKTCEKEEQRLKILEYLLKNSTITKEQIFTQSERKILENARLLAAGNKI